MEPHLDAVFALNATVPPAAPSEPAHHDAPAHDSAVSRGLRAVTHLAATFPLFVLLLIGLLCGLCSLYASKQLGFKTKRADLISPHAAYQQRWMAFTKGFGDVADMVVVVDGKDSTIIKQAMDDLGEQLQREPEAFADVLYKVDTTNLQGKGLQYLSANKVEVLLQRIEQLAPLIRNNCKWLTLNRIYQGVRFKLGDHQEPVDAITQIRMTTLLTDCLAEFCSTRDYKSPWEGLFQLDPGEFQTQAAVTYNMNQKGTLGFVLVKPASGDEGFEGAKRSVERLRDILKDAKETHPQIKFGLTGIPVLEYDEMQASQSAMMWESIISYSGVGILLVLGFRGIRFPIMAMMMLAVATSWSFGFTTGAVGHLNILSVSFVAIVVGLGIDYAILFLSKYMELRQSGKDLTTALLDTSSTIGPGILTAAATTSVAFFCAVFTDFLGVAELGLIAGGGILLCAAAAFTFLPAIVAFVDRFYKPSPIPSPFNGKTLREMTSQHPAVVTVVALALVGLLGGYGFRVTYDYNLMNLQADGLESVEIQKRIAQESDNRLLFAVSLADSPQAALELKKKFEALPDVHRVEEVASVMPRADTDHGRFLVQALEVLLEQLLNQSPERQTPDPDVFYSTLAHFAAQMQTTQLPHAAELAKAISAVQRRLDALPYPKQVALLSEFQFRMASDLMLRLKGLKSVADSTPVSVNDLPAPLVSRFVSKQGKWLLQIYPKEEIWDIDPLQKFIASVRSVDPEVTGIPLQNYEASRQIRTSYETVAMYALLASYFVLLVDFLSFRNIVLGLIAPLGGVVALIGGLVWLGRPLDMHVLALAYVLMTLTLVSFLDLSGFLNILLSLMPPIVGAILTLGTLGIMHVDLNPANLIILPLILGIGVDNGVHVMHDFRLQKLGEYRTSPSLINALFLTSMSNMAGFASMILAAHRGLKSIGLVLTIGVGCCLFISVVLLPALLTLWSRLSSGEQTEVKPAAETPQVDMSGPYVPHDLAIFNPIENAA
jgi:hopanoid biosynthesis associated RND transporter like protein HpnN